MHAFNEKYLGWFPFQNDFLVEELYPNWLYVELIAIAIIQGLESWTINSLN